jgi:SAM-dependent methyltransferase
MTDLVQAESGNDLMRDSRAKDALVEMTPAACLLCGSAPARLLQRIAAAELQAAYRDALGIACRLPSEGVSYLECTSCTLRFFSPPATGDEKFYADLQRISWYYSAGKQEFHMAARQIASTQHVLEIGAGRGLFAREIKPASYTGLEFSPTAIELAAQAGIRLLPQTIEQHATEHHGRYDVVCSFQVLEHVSSPRDFLAAAVKCLRPGGRLLVSVPSEDGFARDAYWDVLNMPPHHVTRWTDKALRAIADIFQLQLVQLEPEPLGRNMRRPYAEAVADRWVARKMGFEPQLLDQRLKRPGVHFLTRAMARFVRKWPGATSAAPRGHAILATFAKP